MFCLFNLLLHVHGKQLRSCHDGQLLNHTVPWQAFLSVYQYLVPILLPVTDNLLFLNLRKSEIFFPQKNYLDVMVDCGTAGCEEDTLPIELLRQATVYVKSKHCVSIQRNTSYD